MTPTALAQAQLDAYNARDLDRFVACYSDTVQVYRMPEAKLPAISGKAPFSAFYASERFNRPALRAELLKRIVLGNKVFDHERITGVRQDAFEMVVVYEVVDGLIQTMWSFSPA